MVIKRVGKIKKGIIKLLFILYKFYNQLFINFITDFVGIIINKLFKMVNLKVINSINAKVYIEIFINSY